MIINGYSIVELMVVISLIGIISASAGTYYAHIIAKAKVKARAQSLYHDIQYARLLLGRHSRIYLCPSTGPYICQADWPAAQYSLFALSENGAPIPILHRTLPKRFQLTMKTFGSHQWLEFQMSPFHITNGSVLLCDNRKKHCAKMVINKAGRVTRVTEILS